MEQILHVDGDQGAVEFQQRGLIHQHFNVAVEFQQRGLIHQHLNVVFNVNNEQILSYLYKYMRKIHSTESSELDDAQ